MTVAGDEWSTDQAAGVAYAWENGLRAERLYRIGIAANNIHEHICIDKCLMLLRKPELWAVLPMRALAVEFRFIAFRLISKIVCGVTQNLVSFHDKLPVAMSKALDSRDAAQDLRRIPKCMRDSWSMSFTSVTL